jgi:hypothetical protein
MKDFFISYTGADKPWAEGLARWLDEAGFTYTLQAADFVAGSNFVLQMHQAVDGCQRLILVLSPDYLTAKFPASEWSAAFAKDPTGVGSTLIGVRVRDCQPGGLLKPIVYIDLVGLQVDKARGKFLSEIMAAISGPRPKTEATPAAPQEPKTPSVSQAATGKNITQVAGDYHHYASATKKKNIITPQPGAISPAQRQHVQKWIESLVENTIGKSREAAFKMWWSRFYNQFHVCAIDQLMRPI